MKATLEATLPLDSFTLFPKLPKELQLCIWELALRPRRIHLSRYTAKAPTYAPDDRFIELKLVKASPHIPILEVCHDSRAAALKAGYMKIHPNRDSNCFYFRPGLDTIYQLENLVYVDTIGRYLTPLGHTIGRKVERKKIVSLAMGDWSLYPVGGNRLSLRDSPAGTQTQFFRLGQLRWTLPLFPALEQLILFNITIAPVVEPEDSSVAVRGGNPPPVNGAERIQGFIQELEMGLKLRIDAVWKGHNVGFSSW